MSNREILRAGFLPLMMIALLPAAPLFAQGVGGLANQPQFQKLAVRVAAGGSIGCARVDGLLIVFRRVSEPGHLEDEFADVQIQPLGRTQITFHDGTLDDLIFGRRSNAALARERVEKLLREKVEAVSQKYGLTEAQQRKVHLAGRGDVKCVFDRFEEIRTKFETFDDIEDANAFGDWLTTLCQEAATLWYGQFWRPFDDGSLFAKAVKTTVTPEQLHRYEEQKASDPTPVTWSGERETTW